MKRAYFSSLVGRLAWAQRRWALIVAAVMLLATSIGFFASNARADSVTNTKTYEVKGVFMESSQGGQKAVIAHEKIAGYMEAMTMSFNVKQRAELKGLKTGDQIEFRLSVTEKDDWIDEIKKTGESGAIRRSAPPPADSVKEVKAGGEIPECVLTNQAGQTIRLSGFRGQALALTFFFSRCPLPSFCPRMNDSFAAAQAALQADGSRTNWQLLSVSFDPGFDTPERLREVADVFRSNVRHWSFATSNAEEIRKLGAAFGLKFWHENGTLSHNLRTVVIDASGRLQKVLAGNEWKPEELLAEMRKAMEKKP